MAENSGQVRRGDTPMKELSRSPSAEAMGAQSSNRPTVRAEGALKCPLELGGRACPREVKVNVERLPHPGPVVREEVGAQAGGPAPAALLAT